MPSVNWSWIMILFCRATRARSLPWRVGHNGPVSRILIVDDSDVLRASVAASLRAQGHQVRALADGQGFAAELTALQPDLVILDVMLPVGPDGHLLLAEARRLSRAGVIMLTARDELAERVQALRMGADDYLTKPFAMVELMARVEAVLRRSAAQGSSIDVGGVTIADDAALVSRDGVQIELTTTERRLLAELARTPDRVVSKVQLLTAVWGYGGYDENIVEVHISSLRRRLDGETGPRIIHTVRGRGYRLGLA